MFISNQWSWGTTGKSLSLDSQSKTVGFGLFLGIVWKIKNNTTLMLRYQMYQDHPVEFRGTWIEPCCWWWGMWWVLQNPPAHSPSWYLSQQLCLACTRYLALSSQLAMFHCGIIIVCKYAGEPVGRTRPDRKSSCCYIQYKQNLHQCWIFSRSVISHGQQRFDSSNLMWSDNNSPVVCFYPVTKCSSQLQLKQTNCQLIFSPCVWNHSEQDVQINWQID